jgi:hypothetical protein
MYSIYTFKSELHHLAAALQPLFSEPFTKYGAILNNDSSVTIFVSYIHEKYGSISPRVRIDKKWDLYEPHFHGKQLSIIFDWLNRIGYEMGRQTMRTEAFKKELIAKTVLAGAPDIREGSDIQE